MGYIMSMAKNVLLISSGRPINWLVCCVKYPSPTGMKAPIRLNTTTEIRIAPVTFLMTNTIVNMMPAKANKVAGSDKSPIETKVAGLSTTKPAFFKPINAINRRVRDGHDSRAPCDDPPQNTY